MFMLCMTSLQFSFFFQAEDGIRDSSVTGVQTCALPISLRSIGNRFSVGPPRSPDALAEVDERLFRNVDMEGADCGCRGVRRRVRRRLGRLRCSALDLGVALAHDALALVCARERTAYLPSKA